MCVCISNSLLNLQIKDNRRADKISAGPQSHILEGVSWDEASRIKDANVSETGDHVVLMGAASKGIIQRGYQHNATVYKAPYAKNPFDSVTDDELNEYKKTVERKRHGDCEYKYNDKCLDAKFILKIVIFQTPTQTFPSLRHSVQCIYLVRQRVHRQTYRKLMVVRINFLFIRSSIFKT